MMMVKEKCVKGSGGLITCVSSVYNAPGGASRIILCLNELINLKNIIVSSGMGLENG